MQTISTKIGAAVTGLVVTMLIVAGTAQAAASPTTGVDYSADLIGPVKSELTLAIVAGLALLVVLMAVKAGIRLVRSFGR